MFRFSLLAFFVGICFLSCQDDDSSDNECGFKGPDIEGTLLDGGTILDISLYCVENEQPIGTGEPYWRYYSRTKTVKDYNAFKLFLFLNRDAHVYTSSDADEMRAIKMIEDDYCKEKSLFILEKYNDCMKKGKPSGWPVLFTAYANGEVSITCDKVLYGQQPGTNLSSYFTVFSPSQTCVPVGVEEPKLLYGFGEEMPTVMSEFFVNETWLQPEYNLWFSKRPSEKYDDLTLFISVPMIVEHTRDIAVAKYRGTELASKYSEKVLNAECRIRFNWD